MVVMARLVDNAGRWMDVMSTSIRYYRYTVRSDFLNPKHLCQYCNLQASDIFMSLPVCRNEQILESGPKGLHVSNLQWDVYIATPCKNLV